MTNRTRNNKSEQRTVRIPLDVLTGVELTQHGGESMGQYIINALRGEIVRRQVGDIRGVETALAFLALEEVKGRAINASAEISSIIAAIQFAFFESKDQPEKPIKSSRGPLPQTDAG